METIAPAQHMAGASLLPIVRPIPTLELPGIDIGWRVIALGDEFALTPIEFRHFAHCVAKVRRASGAARIAARDLFQRHGIQVTSIAKSPAGVPLWPDGWVGSLAHDGRLAVAAIARRRDFAGIGIDVEPAEALDPEILDRVTTPHERMELDRDPCRGRLYFAVKEAVYKAAYPLDRQFLDHHQVEVDLAALTARVATGRNVRFRYGVASHIVAIATIEA